MAKNICVSIQSGKLIVKYFESADSEQLLNAEVFVNNIVEHKWVKWFFGMIWTKNVPHRERDAQRPFRQIII